MPLAVAAILISGCAGSGYLKELNRYSKKVKGPDISTSEGVQTPAPVETTEEGEEGQATASPTAPAESLTESSVNHAGMGETMAPSPTPRTTTDNGTYNEPVRESARPLSPATGKMEGKAGPSSDTRLKRESRAGMRKSDREPPEIDWGNNSRKDWFFLIMSGLGLIVGLFGVGFGWIVFLVFGGLYLYRKIVKRR